MIFKDVSAAADGAADAAGDGGPGQAVLLRGGAAQEEKSPPHAARQLHVPEGKRVASHRRAEIVVTLAMPINAPVFLLKLRSDDHHCQ